MRCSRHGHHGVRGELLSGALQLKNFSAKF